MNRISIKAYLQTITWFNDKIVDWAQGGTAYTLDGASQTIGRYGYGSSYGFDSSITSEDGQYVFLYKRLGTKGLLLKNGEELREINRSYYHADVYEYPAVFLTIDDGATFLVHCPFDYCRLDFENVETGEIITNSPDRKPQDFFHSRLEVSPDKKYIASKGWIWHPIDSVEVFEVEAALADPCHLDSGKYIPKVTTELCTASFIDNDRILVGTSTEPPLDEEQQQLIPPRHIAIWHFKTNEVTNVVKVNGEFGNIIAIDENYCWDLFQFPKIIDIRTGEVVDKIEEISTGMQQSSIISHMIGAMPLIAYNRKMKKLAIASDNTLEILWRE